METNNFYGFDENGSLNSAHTCDIFKGITDYKEDNISCDDAPVEYVNKVNDLENKCRNIKIEII